MLFAWLARKRPVRPIETHLKKLGPTPRSRQTGQGMTEYIIIVALVAVAAIAVYQSFGRVIRSQTAAIANELAGESSRTAISNAGSAARDANQQIKNRSLKSYGASSR